MLRIIHNAGLLNRRSGSFALIPASLIAIVSLSSMMTGCAQLSRQAVATSVPVNKNISAWEQRKAKFLRDSNWTLVSKIGLSYRDEYWQFGLNWAQKTAQQYAMQIKNPLTGAIVARLTQNRQGVTLLADDGKTYHSKDAERLLESQSGVYMPVKGMPYWVRGITSPQYKVDKLALDRQGRPTLIQQAGWLIQYPSYQGVNATALPRKITFKRARDNLSLKLVAKQWRGI